MLPRLCPQTGRRYFTSRVGRKATHRVGTAPANKQPPFAFNLLAERYRVSLIYPAMMYLFFGKPQNVNVSFASKRLRAILHIYLLRRSLPTGQAKLDYRDPAGNAINRFAHHVRDAKSDEWFARWSATAAPRPCRTLFLGDS